MGSRRKPLPYTGMYNYLCRLAEGLTPDEARKVCNVSLLRYGEWRECEDFLYREEMILKTRAALNLTQKRSERISQTAEQQERAEIEEEGKKDTQRAQRHRMRRSILARVHPNATEGEIEQMLEKLNQANNQ